MKINQFLSLPPETLTRTLPDIGDNLGFIALASPGVM
jgi:hypothetical protein